MMIPFCSAFIKGKVLTCLFAEPGSHQEQEEHITLLPRLSNNFGQGGPDLRPDFHFFFLPVFPERSPVLCLFENYLQSHFGTLLVLTWMYKWFPSVTHCPKAEAEIMAKDHVIARCYLWNPDYHMKYENWQHIAHLLHSVLILCFQCNTILTAL